MSTSETCGYLLDSGEPCRRRGGPCADHRWPVPTMRQLAQIPETDDAITRFLKGITIAAEDYRRRGGAVGDLPG